MKISFKSCASIPEFILEVSILFLFSLLVSEHARGEIDPGFRDVVIFATNSVHIQKDTLVKTGDVVVNDASQGPTLEAGAELSLDTNVIIKGKGIADSIVLDKGASIADSQCNDGTGLVCGGLSLPVFNELPPFKEASIPPVVNDVVVGNGETVVLDEGSYGNIIIGIGGTVEFTGKNYDVVSINGGRTAQLKFTQPTELKILERLALGRGCFVGPVPGLTATAANILIYVGGMNQDPNDPHSSPAAAAFGRECSINANVWAANGTLDIDRVLSATGVFFGRDVKIDSSGEINLANSSNPPPTGAGNRLPTADLKAVLTNGTTPLLITLTGSDPDGEFLDFEIVSDPSHGLLTDLTQISPSSATVIYTANKVGDLEDSFIFRVTDPHGGFDEAVVSINPVDPSIPPPAPTNTVIAKDGSYEVALKPDEIITLNITLIGYADVANPDPDPNFLEFTISSLPSLGTLGALVNNTVPYTPTTAGDDSFVFQVCGDLNNDGDTLDPGECDTATISITVNPFTPPVPPVAEDFSVFTEPDTEVSINLGSANEGSPGQNPRSRLQLAATGENTANNGENDGPAAAAPVELTSITVGGGWVFFNDCAIGTPCPDGPFTFNTNGIACVSVTDAFVKSDEFTVSDNGQLLGNTSPGFPDDGNNESDADLAFADPEFSSGTFGVGAGTHSIEVVRHKTQLDPPGLAAAFIRVDSLGTAYCPTFTNLTVTSFSAPIQAELGEVIGDDIQVTVTNTGTLDIASGTLSSIGFYISTDPMITTTDTLLIGGRENLATSAPNGLAVGESIENFLFSGASVNGASPTGNVFIGVVVDESNTLIESDETDNTDSQAILIGEGVLSGQVAATITSLSQPFSGKLIDPSTESEITSASLPYKLKDTGVTYIAPEKTVENESLSYKLTNEAGDSLIAEVFFYVQSNCVTALSACDDGRPDLD